MNAIEDIMDSESAKWVNERVTELPNRAKFRAYSAIRSLQWASRNFHTEMPIPAAFFALHATEEAVAAFLSSAKECGYGTDAKINLKDHMAKATVSLLAQKVSNFMAEYELAVAVAPEKSALIVRFTLDGAVRYAEASTNLFHFTEGMHGDRKAHFLEELIEAFGDIRLLKEAVIETQEVRNNIFYATSTGLPTGFIDPEASLRRECNLTLGLIWAAIDINRNREQQIPFIVQALRTANLVIEAVKAK